MSLGCVCGNIALGMSEDEREDFSWIATGVLNFGTLYLLKSMDVLFVSVSNLLQSLTCHIIRGAMWNKNFCSIFLNTISISIDSAMAPAKGLSIVDLCHPNSKTTGLWCQLERFVFLFTSLSGYRGICRPPASVLEDPFPYIGLMV